MGAVWAFIALAWPPVTLHPSDLAAQTRPQPGPTFRVEIDFVNVDVTVTDDGGAFVRDLGPDDFEVYEDGKRQDVAAFSLVDIPVAAAGPVPAPGAVTVEPDVRTNGQEAGTRTYIIVLDDLHVHPLRSARVKQVARQFVEQYLGPSDLAAVLHTSGRTEASQGFTTDRRLLLNAIDGFMGRKLRSSTLERLEEYERRREQETRADLRLNRTPDPLDLQRADQARRMLSTLGEISKLLALARNQRKAMLLISEGVDYPLIMDVTQTSSGLTTFMSDSAPEVLRALQQTIREASRANVSVYSVDPRGLATMGDEGIEVSTFPESPHYGLTPTTMLDELRRAQDSLRTLSEETGGLASVTSNDFSGAFDRIVRDNSTYYMLGYRSSNERRDGRYRKIDVKVKRRGVRVRARSGYAVSASPTATGLVSAAAEPSAPMRDTLNSPLPVTILPLRVFAVPFRTGADPSVMVGVEVDAGRFRFDRKQDRYTDRLDVAILALDHEDRLKTSERQTVEMELEPATYQAVQANGVRVFARLTLPAGRYQLRVAAYETGTDATGSVFYDLEVPDFAKAPVSVSGLVITSTSAPRTPTARPDATMSSMLPAPPTGQRLFTAEESLLVFCEVYQTANATGPVDLTVLVRDADQQVRFRSEEQAEGQAIGGTYRAFGYALEIPLADLPAGRYTLAVEARSKGLPAAVQAVPFEMAAEGVPR